MFGGQSTGFGQPSQNLFGGSFGQQGGLFNQQASSPQTNTLFGTTGQTSSNLFGGQTQQQSPTSFGQAAAGTTGGLFSASQQPTGGGLFGSTTSGGLFGSTQPAAATGGGLFGSTQPAAGGGLFGNTQQGAGGGLFGNTQGGVFGTTNQGSGTQNAGTGGFGQSQAANTGQGAQTSLFGGSQNSGLFTNNATTGAPAGATAGAQRGQQQGLFGGGRQTLVLGKRKEGESDLVRLTVRPSVRDIARLDEDLAYLLEQVFLGLQQSEKQKESIQDELLKVNQVCEDTFKNFEFKKTDLSVIKEELEDTEYLLEDQILSIGRLEKLTESLSNDFNRIDSCLLPIPPIQHSLLLQEFCISKDLLDRALGSITSSLESLQSNYTEEDKLKNVALLLQAQGSIIKNTAKFLSSAEHTLAEIRATL